MSKLVKNLCVKVREYNDHEGNKKAQWLNIGSIMATDDGKTFMLLDRHVNLAGLPFKEGSTAVIVAMFDPKNDKKETQVFAQTESNQFGSDEMPF